VFSILYRLADAARDCARRRRWSRDLASGRRGEDLAHRLLRRAGLTVVARNYRPRSGAGEIDVIAWEGTTLVFVEVKSRASDEYGTPDRAVDSEKRKHLERVARDYALRAGVDWGRVRFDIVSITAGRWPELRHLRDVFRPQAGKPHPPQSL
jgi:putative endonuclease